MRRPAQVALIIDHLATGGAQEFVYHLCRRLRPDEVHVSVCALRAGGEYETRLTDLGVPVTTLVSSRAPWQAPVAAGRLWRWFGATPCDVVHTLLEGAHVLATPLARLARRPVVHSIMATRQQVSGWYFSSLAAYQRWVAAYLTPIPGELIACGIATEKIKVVEVAPDLSTLLDVSHNVQQVLLPFELSDSFPVVVSIGRLHLDKGHEYAIRAWPLVLARWPQARLLIIGDGDDKPRLCNLVDQLGLAHTIAFAGFRRDLAQILSRADVVLRTSINEGVNLTTIQAMAAGVPVIGFAVPGPKEIIRHAHTGWLVPLRDAAALAQAMITLCEDEPLRLLLGTTAREQVRQYYDIQAVAALYSNIYTALRDGQPLTDVPDLRESIATFDQRFARNDAAISRLRHD